jgi:poly [ADP-ribose] polymerase
MAQSTVPIPTTDPDEMYMYQYTNMGHNNNKDYLYKVWDRGGNNVHVVGIFGRVGETHVTWNYGPITRKKFESMIRERIRPESEGGKGYKPVDLHKPTVQTVATPSAPSVTIDSAVATLTNLIFSESGSHIKTYLATTVEQLSQSQILQGRAYLTQAQNLLNTLITQSSSSRIRDVIYYAWSATNSTLNELVDVVETFYNTIPTRLPRKIERREVTTDFCSSLSEQEDRLDQLEAAIATNKVVTRGGSQVQAIGADIKRVTDPAIYDQIKKLVTSTAVHGYSIRILDIYEVEIPAERSAYTANKIGVSNKQMLFHGTRNANVLHILRSGLIIPSMASNGRMLGNGIYFANKASKSTNYCSNTSYSAPYMLLIAEAALGNMYIAPQATGYNSPPSGYDSVFGKAGHTRTYGYGTLANDEFVVYKPQQQTIRYLVTFTK